MMKNKKLKIGEFNEGSVELGPEELSSKDTKVRITMFVDSDTLSKFKTFAELTGGKYQSLLNECLNDGTDKFLERKLKEVKRGIERFERKKA